MLVQLENMYHAQREAPGAKHLSQLESLLGSGGVGTVIKNQVEPCGRRMGGALHSAGCEAHSSHGWHKRSRAPPTSKEKPSPLKANFLEACAYHPLRGDS